jgi:hypothetical protein
MEDGDEEFEDAADLPNISKMTMAQVRSSCRSALPAAGRLRRRRTALHM